MKCLSHPQTIKCLRVWWWLHMFPGQREVSTGDTASAWRHVLVRHLLSRNMCGSQILPLLSGRSCVVLFKNSSFVIFPAALM